MKKLSFVLAVCLVLSMCGCGSNKIHTDEKHEATTAFTTTSLDETPKTIETSVTDTDRNDRNNTADDPKTSDITVTEAQADMQSGHNIHTGSESAVEDAAENAAENADEDTGMKLDIISPDIRSSREKNTGSPNENNRITNHQDMEKNTDTHETDTSAGEDAPIELPFIPTS